jgi:hypothetical protein
MHHRGSKCARPFRLPAEHCSDATSTLYPDQSSFSATCHRRSDIPVTWCTGGIHVTIRTFPPPRPVSHPPAFAPAPEGPRQRGSRPASTESSGDGSAATAGTPAVTSTHAVPTSALLTAAEGPAQLARQPTAALSARRAWRSAEQAEMQPWSEHQRTKARARVGQSQPPISQSRWGGRQLRERRVRGGGTRVPGGRGVLGSRKGGPRTLVLRVDEYERDVVPPGGEVGEL